MPRYGPKLGLRVSRLENEVQMELLINQLVLLISLVLSMQSAFGVRQKAQLFDEKHEPKFPSLKLRCPGLGLGNGHRGGKLKFLVQIWFGFSLPIQIDLNFIISH